MSLSGPVPLASNHQIEGFRCGRPMLDDWLRYARQAQSSGSARTYVVLDDKRLAAYYSLTVGQIDSIEASARLRQGMGHHPIPVVILARLAVDVNYQGQGIGFAMLQDAIYRALRIADEAGIRALLTHPIDSQADAFYRKFGFEPTPLRERQLVLLLKDARRLVGA